VGKQYGIKIGAIWEQFAGHTKLAETFRMLLGTFGGNKKNLQVFKTLYIRED
jgi:hypothetical protein